jgi:uncharacterized repeat protein (TIGR03943 family)
MTREIQSIILMLVGIATLRISWGTVYLNYVKESMRPWLLLSGAVLVVLGLWMLVDALRGHADELTDADEAHADQGDASVEYAHASAHPGPRAAWLLLVPVLTIFLVAPPALGAYSASRDTTNSISTDQAMAALPAGDPVPLYLSDYVTRAVWDEGRTLVGRIVQLTGFVLTVPEGGWQLARLQLTCCAADAFASKVQPINLAPEAQMIPEGTWVNVTGEWVAGEGLGTEETIPLIDVVSVVGIQPPVNPYD